MKKSSIVFSAAAKAVMETLLVLFLFTLVFVVFAELFWNFAPEQWHEWFNNATGYRGG